MSKQYYECHVTMMCEKIEVIEEHVSLLGWKFSCIDGDPILGEGLKCYATKHYPAAMSATDVIRNVQSIALQLSSKGHNVIRDKVELVIYDSKLVNIK